MKTFHVSTPIRHSFADSFARTIERAADNDPKTTALALNVIAAMLAAQNKNARPTAGVAPRAAAVRLSTVPAKGAGSGPRTSASKDSAGRSFHSAHDKRRAAAFLPESTLTAHLRLNGRDTSAAEAMLAEHDRKRARAATYQPTLPGTPQYMTSRDRQRAAEFAHLPSSLDVWRAQQSRKAREMSPEDELVHDNPGMAGDARTRDFLDHQAEMKAIAQGRKPAARSAPRSDRGGYRG